MSTGRICTRVVATASPVESVRAAARRMQEHGVGTLVVLDADGSRRPTGVVTDRDLAMQCISAEVDLDQTRVADVMSEPVRSVDEHTPIEEAVREMARAATRRLVVTGEDGQLVGVLSLDDVLELLVGELDGIRQVLAQQAMAIPV